MPKPKRPRFGSMGVWPRKRAKNMFPRVRAVAKVKEAKLLAFPVYKAGMTRIFAVNTDKNKRMGGQEEVLAGTVLECPPIKIASLKLYSRKDKADYVVTQLNFKTEKEFLRASNVPKEKFAKSEDVEKLNAADYTDATIQIYTMPKLIDLKKTPDTFEISLGGTVKEKLEFVKNHFDKQINLLDVFKAGQFVDAHGITTGKGFQGPVKRFGVGLKSHKSEKGQRAVGSLGGWSRQGHVMYRVAHAGQMGFHQRVQYNNQILRISDKPETVNPKGGFLAYGEVTSSFVIVKGSIMGAKKRLIVLTEPIRLKTKAAYSPESVKHVSTRTQQG
ncbi:MAG: 50S ribosomal protein L3 [Candidatus Woesearchaeota archaeon]|jgi:large subunit ribosomal protein L3